MSGNAAYAGIVVEREGDDVLIVALTRDPRLRSSPPVVRAQVPVGLQGVGTSGLRCEVDLDYEVDGRIATAHLIALELLPRSPKPPPTVDDTTITRDIG